MIYFDNAATSFPKSEQVFDAMKEAYFGSGNAGRSGHELANEGARIVYNCRRAAGALFGCEPENVVLTKNATEALNLAIKGVIKKSAKSEVLISSLEHNSVLRPVHAFCAENRMTYKQFDVDLYNDDNTVNNFKKALTRRTTAAVITHASNVCGRILPVKRISEIAKKYGILLILDASQTAGHIPVTFENTGADIICLPGHKGLYGPMGTGLMLIRSDRIHFRTIMEGGTGISSFEKEMPNLLPERLEYGTQNICGFAGLAAAMENFEYPAEEKRVFAYLLKKMRVREDIVLHGAPKDNIEDFVPVLLFNKKDTPCEEVAAQLNEKGIAVRAGFHCSPLAHKALGTQQKGGVRISLGRANTVEEIDYFLSML